MTNCQQCIHLAVCGTYDATGGNVRNCKHFVVTMPQHPCIACVYYKVCVESNRTEPCYGRMTKRERRAEDGK